jgi:hypothetical protein
MRLKQHLRLIFADQDHDGDCYRIFTLPLNPRHIAGLSYGQYKEKKQL